MIPARMGSKRVPKKNIRILKDKPLIQYPINLALQCTKLSEIWINTESELLGRYAETLGVKFYKRPDELASDQATNREFMYDFLKKHECDYVIMINPTSPLISKNTMDNLIKMLESDEYDTILSTVAEKTECFFEQKPVNFDKDKKINSQLIEPVYRTIWALTVWKRDTFIKNQENHINPIFNGKIGLFQIPKYESCDIDVEEDWIVAEKNLNCHNGDSPRYLEL